MVNILGDLWGAGTPAWEKVLEAHRTYLHLYGKSKAVVGRKMGHITQLGDSSAAAADSLRSLRNALRQ